MHKIIFLFFLIFSSNSFSEQKEFIIGVENLDYLPFSIVRNNKYEGFNQELLNEFANDNGYTFTFQPLPIPRIYASLFNKDIDFKFPDNPNWKQKEKKNYKIYYSNQVIACIDGVFSKEDMPTSKISKIGIINGFTPWAIKEDIENKKLQTIESNNISSLINLLFHNRTDAIYASYASVKYYMSHNNNNNNIKFNKEMPYIKDYYYLSSLKHPKIITEFNDWILKNQNKIQKIKEKWHIDNGLENIK